MQCDAQLNHFTTALVQTEGHGRGVSTRGNKILDMFTCYAAVTFIY